MITEQFDLPILDWIAAHLQSPFGDAAMPAISFLGNGGWIWIATALVLLFFPKYRQTGFAMGIGLLIGVLCANVVLKPLIARMRPYEYQWVHFHRVIDLLIQAPRDYSFPSGHTMASTVSATVLLIRERKLGIAAAILAGLIAFSRLYLYVHYPTDVLSSIILGAGIGFIATHLADKDYTLYERKK